VVTPDDAPVSPFESEGRGFDSLGRLVESADVTGVSSGWDGRPTRFGVMDPGWTNGEKFAPSSMDSGSVAEVRFLHGTEPQAVHLGVEVLEREMAGDLGGIRGALWPRMRCTAVRVRMLIVSRLVLPHAATSAATRGLWDNPRADGRRSGGLTFVSEEVAQPKPETPEPRLQIVSSAFGQRNACLATPRNWRSRKFTLRARKSSLAGIVFGLRTTIEDKVRIAEIVERKVPRGGQNGSRILSSTLLERRARD